MQHTFFRGVVAASALIFAAAVGCSAPEPSNGNGPVGAGNSSSGNGNGNGNIDLGSTGGTGSGTGGDGNQTECKVIDGEEFCVCIKLATWGALGAFGAVPGMDGQDAIAAWLNENSTGDADYTATKPVITAETLAPYKVILLQDLSGWAAFTPDELAAFEGWVRAGGGVISLNGYSANGNEMANVNALLAFSGLSYVPNSDTVGDNYIACQYCYGSSAPMGGWVATHPISTSIKDVGAYHGRSIMVGAGAEIVAQTSEGILGATAAVDAGRVFMFHDEWVTYNSQWTGEGLKDTCLYNDPNNMCNDKHPTNDYSSAQFWYNAIKWSSGDPACFKIADETIVR